MSPFSGQAPGETDRARVLILSQREINAKVYQCYIYEFEDAIQKMDSADLLAPISGVHSESRLLLRRSLNRGRKMMGLLPRSEIVSARVEQDYDLFFVVFQFPYQIAMLNKIRDWRKRCKKAVCLLNEVWTKDIARSRRDLRLLADFDQVFVPTKVSVEPVSAAVGRECKLFNPFAVDMDQFCPFPNLPARSIDLLSIGRYSPVLHQDLLKLAAADEIFYYYDTVHNFSVHNWKTHRCKYAQLLKRSRYFLAYNLSLNKLDVTGGDEALMPRLFEGAAAGAAVIGIPPRCSEYLDAFPWPDAVLPFPYEPKDLRQSLSALDGDLELLARVRRDNVVNCLQRHDWLHRWERILEAARLPHTEAMGARRASLEARAESSQPLEPWLSAETRTSDRSTPDSSVPQLQAQRHSVVLASGQHA